ncbi:MAG: NINE protein [Saprospiraceae bacterium]
MKSQSWAAILAFFLGIFGVHRFYLGQRFIGILYLVAFFIGFIATVEGEVPLIIAPAIVAFIDAVLLAVQPREDFDRKYNRRQSVHAPYNVDELKKEGVHYFRAREYDLALEAFEDALDLRPDDAAIFFNIACCFAQLHQTGNAIENLQAAFNSGFDRPARLDTHPALAWLRRQPEYVQWRENTTLPTRFPTSNAYPDLTPLKLPDDADVFAGAPDPTTDLLSQIAKLGRLREEGILTEAEFRAQKEKLLELG